MNCSFQNLFHKSMVAYTVYFTSINPKQLLSVRIINIIIIVVLLAIRDHTGFVCYDDGCHLHKFARNPSRSSLTATASRIANLEIVIDRMHFKGHVDSWCKQNYNPDNFMELNDVRLAGSILNIWSQILTLTYQIDFV